MLATHKIYTRLTLVFCILCTSIACTATPTRESTGQYVDNTVITTKVKTALLNSATVSATAVEVESYKGTVQLSGFVNTKAQKQEAERIAAGISGVQEVENNIIVKQQ